MEHLMEHSYFYCGKEIIKYRVKIIPFTAYGQEFFKAEISMNGRINCGYDDVQLRSGAHKSKKEAQEWILKNLKMLMRFVAEENDNANKSK